MFINMKKFVEMLDNEDRRDLLELLSKPGMITPRAAATGDEIDILKSGSRIEAIKAYRKRLDCSLRTARRAICELEE